MFGRHYYQKLPLKFSNFLSALSFNPSVSTSSLRASGHALFSFPASLVLVRNTSFEKPISFSPGFSHLREQLGLSGLRNNTTIIIFNTQRAHRQHDFLTLPFQPVSDDLLWVLAAHYMYVSSNWERCYRSLINKTQPLARHRSQNQRGWERLKWIPPCGHGHGTWRLENVHCISTAVGTVRHGHLDVHLCGLENIL